MADEHRPVKYEHDACNVTAGAVHLFVSTSRKIEMSIRLVRCVRDEGLAHLDIAMSEDNLFAVVKTYADCVGKLENALLVFDNNPTIYDDILADRVGDYAALAKRLRAALDAKLREYHVSVYDRLAGAA